MSFMHALKARVVNGRYVIDEPAHLPEGAEVELVVLGSGMSAEERTALVQAIEEAEQDIEAGRVVDEAEVWARLKAIEVASGTATCGACSTPRHCDTLSACT